MRNGLKGAFKRRNILKGREIKHNFRQNRLVIAICESLGACRRWKTYPLRSAFEMVLKRRLNVEISQTGGK